MNTGRIGDGGEAGNGVWGAQRELHDVLVWLACCGCTREMGVSQALRDRTPLGYARYVVESYDTFMGARMEWNDGVGA